jgi:uncharacterized protein YrzB (UPF0473 family)
MMHDEHDEPRDYITIEDEQGNVKDFAVEALFDMEEESYALLQAKDETIVMKIEGEEGNQDLVGIEDPLESEAILDAYQIAVENAPAEND